MRILYVEPLGVTGGMGEYNDQLAPAYAAAGHRVSVLTTSASDHLRRSTTVHISRVLEFARRRSLPRVVRGAAYALGAATVVMRALGADVVIYHHFHAPAIDDITLRLLHRIGRRIVGVAHDPRPFGRPATSRYRSCLRRCDVLVVHGPVARRDLLELGVHAERVVVARFGQFRPTAAYARDVAETVLGIHGLSRPVVAVIGNLRPEKGVGLALRAIEHVHHPNATLLIAGEKQGDWDLEGLLAASTSRGARVVRLARRMSAAEELAAYSVADVVLALYETGYSSGVIARAHAIGRRLVISDVGDVPSQAWPSDVVLVPGATPGDVGEAISGLIAHEPLSDASAIDDTWQSHVLACEERLGKVH